MLKLATTTSQEPLNVGSRLHYTDMLKAQQHHRYVVV